MLMPDVTEILDDPEVGSGVAFQVRRKSSHRKLGGWEKTETVYDATGNLQPQNKSSQSSTAEDLLSESIVIYSTFVFQNGQNNGAEIIETDEVLWENEVWRVTSVQNWAKWGFTVANAEKVRG